MASSSSSLFRAFYKLKCRNLLPSSNQYLPSILGSRNVRHLTKLSHHTLFHNQQNAMIGGLNGMTTLTKPCSTATLEADNYYDDSFNSELLTDDEQEKMNKYGKELDEIQRFREAGELVPESISMHHLERYAEYSYQKKLSFLRYRFTAEAKKKNKQMKRKASRESLLTEEPRSDELNNTILRRFSKQYMTRALDARVVSGMLFGPKVAIDFDYDDLMSKKEILNMIKQVLLMVNSNRNAKEPFDVHWVNLKKDSATFQEICKKDSHAVNVDRYMVQTTEDDLLSKFPKEKLMYLTADSPNVMERFDEDRIYVIGGIIDKSNELKHTTLAKAKRYGIEHCRLPLDRYLKWQKSSKNLCLNQVLDILLTLSETDDWEKSLGHVPTRKYDGFRSNDIKSLKFDQAFREDNAFQLPQQRRDGGVRMNKGPRVRYDSDLPFHQQSQRNRVRFNDKVQSRQNSYNQVESSTKLQSDDKSQWLDEATKQEHGTNFHTRFSFSRANKN